MQIIRDEDEKFLKTLKDNKKLPLLLDEKTCSQLSYVGSRSYEVEGVICNILNELENEAVGADSKHRMTLLHHPFGILPNETDWRKMPIWFFVSGGNNGNPNWPNYLLRINNFIKELNDRYVGGKIIREPIVTGIMNDIADDVFTLGVQIYLEPIN